MPCKLQISRNLVSCTLHDKRASGDYRVITGTNLSEFSARDRSLITKDKHCQHLSRDFLSLPKKEKNFWFPFVHV